jgi:hypothetical protein
VFDVGETLVDEIREYGSWADWPGVPRHTSSATFVAVIPRGADYRDGLVDANPSGFSGSLVGTTSGLYSD